MLKLPIRAFFSFYQEAVRLEAIQYREQLDIAIVGKMKFEYYERLRSRYNAHIYKAKKELPEKPPSMHLDAAGTEAKDLLFSLMRNAKRGMGYGG